MPWRRRATRTLRPFETYLETFKLGMPPHGGFAIGLERFIMQLLGLDNMSGWRRCSRGI